MKRVIVIGAGHNGLVAAFYLAKAGLKPLVLERRPDVGGAAITEEFHPGYRCSTLAHAGGPLAPTVARDLRLDRRGLESIHPDARVFAPRLNGPPLTIFADVERTTRELASLSTADAARYVEYREATQRIGMMLAPLLVAPPPSIDDPTFSDVIGALTAGRQLHALGKKNAYRLLRWGPMAVADLAAEWFESEPLRAVTASRGIFGAHAGPWSAGTGAIFLLRAALDAQNGGDGGFVRGGLGALTRAIADAAREAGAEIRTGADVVRIAVVDGVATGVVLENGEEIAADALVSNVDPRRTLLGLIDPVHLEPGFLTKIRNFRSTGVTAKVNLALAALPTFASLAPEPADRTTRLSGHIHIGPEIDYLERAFDASKYGRFSPAPYLDIRIPTLIDPSLAPAGHHVMSICMQYAPYDLRQTDWTQERDRLTHTVISTLARFAPDLESKIVGLQLITPLDLERTYGLTRGHIFHGDLTLDQLFTMRPLLGWAQHRTPLRHLYLCGAGTHPGIGITGISGANASREVIRDLRAS